MLTTRPPACPPPLLQLYVEAKDNVKFLTTLERHFKNISGGNLTAILDTLPSMMNAIRMVSCPPSPEYLFHIFVPFCVMVVRVRLRLASCVTTRANDKTRFFSCV